MITFSREGVECSGGVVSSRSIDCSFSLRGVTSHICPFPSTTTCDRSFFKSSKLQPPEFKIGIFTSKGTPMKKKKVTTSRGATGIHDRRFCRVHLRYALRKIGRF